MDNKVMQGALFVISFITFQLRHPQDDSSHIGTAYTPFSFALLWARAQP